MEVGDHREVAQEEDEVGESRRQQVDTSYLPCTDILTIVCSFLHNLLQMNSPSHLPVDGLGLRQNISFESSDIANSLLFLWRNKDQPKAKEMLDQVHSTCLSNDHLHDIIESAINSKTNAFKDVCMAALKTELQTNATAEKSPQDSLLVTLQKKAARIEEKKEQVARLLQQKREIFSQTEATLLCAAKKVEEAAHGIFNENNAEEQRYDHLLNTCKDVVDNQLETLKMEAKLKYYTTEKIEQLREQKIRFTAIRSQLEQNVSALEERKKGYDSLGPEFKKIAKDYGNILREIEVENRIMLAFPSP